VTRPADATNPAPYLDKRGAEWLLSLKRRWRQKRSEHPEILLAVHVLFPDHAEEISAWLEGG
jgi:hypothetical protein